MSEREREKERLGERKREREKERESVFDSTTRREGSRLKRHVIYENVMSHSNHTCTT